MNTEITDPHESKVASSDRRTRAKVSVGRTLRKGPAIALVALGVGLLFVALIIALSPSEKASEKKADSVTTEIAVPPMVPDAIRNAPGGPATPGQPERVAPLSNTAPAARAGAHYGYSGSDPRAEQRERAMGAGILFDTARSPTSSASSRPLSSDNGAGPTSHGASGARSDNGDSDPNMQAHKNAFLDSEGAARSGDILPERVVRSRSPYEVKAGSIVPAVLITGINSDLPGPVIGQVRENVYDTVTGNILLIPQGSRLTAQYDSMVSWGQERVLICWNRLIFPNGDSIRLDCMPGADLAGAAGITDSVNEHWGRILKGAAVATLLSAGTAFAAGNTQGMNPTVGQQTARSAASTVGQVGQQVTARNMNIQPTITVRPGFSINVIVTKDMVMPGAYGASTSAKGY